MKKLIVATDHQFWFEDRGDRQRIAKLLKYLITLPLETVVFYLGNLREEEQRLYHKSFGEAEIYFVKEKQLYSLKNEEIVDHKLFIKDVKLPKREIKNNLINRLLKKPRVRELSEYERPTFIAPFEWLVNHLKPEFIMIQYIRLDYLMSEQLMQSKVIKIIDLHDLMYKRYLSFRKHGSQHWVKISKKAEFDLISKYDFIIAIQDKEKAELNKSLPKKNILTIKHACTLNASPKKHRKKNLVIGYLATPGEANIKAIKWFVSRVWPSLKRTHPNVTLAIAGSICEKLTFNEERIVIKGQVNKLQDFYFNSDIIINPVFMGGGLKIKNVEALCHGKPLVTSSIGAEGIENGIGKAFLVANKKREMVNHISKLLTENSTRIKLSDSAEEFALATFNEDVVYSPLDQIFNLYSPRDHG